jgi:myo-inositol-1(or 4)-monophosphatase
MKHSPIIQVMLRAAIAASKGIIRDFGEIDKLQISKKGVANFVTSADLRSEKIILESLEKARPKMAYLSEESGAGGPEGAEERFVIDPIDGTTNFIHAIPYIAISIAAQKRDDNGVWYSYAGIIYDPLHDELFTAEKGGGAFLNQNYRLKTSERDAQALIGGTSPRTYRNDYQRTSKLFNALADAGFTLRCSGSAALDLVYVAAGRLDASWYHCLNSWDMAAAALIVTEAGGKVSRENGDLFTTENGSVVAANQLVHGKIIEVLCGVLDQDSKKPAKASA